MKRLFGRHNVWLCSVSAGRPQEVGPMQEKLGKLTWYAPEEEWNDYKKHGAEGVRPGSNQAVVPIRNRAMQDAWEQGLPCVQLDDDLKRVMTLTKGRTSNGWRSDPAGVRHAMEVFIEEVMLTPYYLGGVPPTNNVYFADGNMHSHVFCRSHIWLVKPNELLLDPNLLTKFDYDYSLSHMQRYGGVARYDGVIFDFDFGHKAGGHVATRTKIGERNSVEYLQRKWGKEVVRGNPKRPNEVILHPPKPKRARITLI